MYLNTTCQEPRLAQRMLNVTNEGKFRLLWGNTMVQTLKLQIVAFYKNKIKTFSYEMGGY